MQFVCPTAPSFCWQLDAAAGAAEVSGSEGFGWVDRSGRVGPVARTAWPRSAAPALPVRASAVVWLVVVWLVWVWVWVWVWVVVESAAAEAVMVVADRALAEAGGAVRAAAVPAGRLTGRAG